MALGPDNVLSVEEIGATQQRTPIRSSWAAVSRSRGRSASCPRIWVICSHTMLLQSDLAGERSQFAAENKTASERTFVRFFSTKHGSLRITVGRWLPKETPIRSAPRLEGIFLIPITRRGSPWWGVLFFPSGKKEMHRGPSFCCGMLFQFTDSKGAPYLALKHFSFLGLSSFELNLK